MNPRYIPALLLAVVFCIGVVRADDQKAPPHMSKQTRMDLIRAFNFELVYIRSPFPMGKTGLTLKEGQLTPDGEQLQRMMAMWGPALKPGDQARISQILVKNDRIHFEINGGAVKKQKWYQHIQVSGRRDRGRPRRVRVAARGPMASCQPLRWPVKTARSRPAGQRPLPARRPSGRPTARDRKSVV